MREAQPCHEYEKLEAESHRLSAQHERQSRMVCTANLDAYLKVAMTLESSSELDELTATVDRLLRGF
jgi:hypothetical protein